METQINLLRQIIANQVTIFQRLEKIEKSLNGGARSAPIKTYVDELRKEAEKALPYIQ